MSDWLVMSRNIIVLDLANLFLFQRASLALEAKMRFTCRAQGSEYYLFVKDDLILYLQGWHTNI